MLFLPERLLSEHASTLQFRERSISVARTGETLGDTPQFSHGARFVGEWTKIQVHQPVCGIQFVGARRIGCAAQPHEQFARPLRIAIGAQLHLGLGAQQRRLLSVLRPHFVEYFGSRLDVATNSKRFRVRVHRLLAPTPTGFEYRDGSALRE